MAAGGEDSLNGKTFNVVSNGFKIVLERFLRSIRKGSAQIRLDWSTSIRPDKSSPHDLKRSDGRIQTYCLLFKRLPVSRRDSIHLKLQQLLGINNFSRMARSGKTNKECFVD